MQTDPMLDGFLKERESKLQLIESLKTAAHETGRDLNEDDKTSITAAKERIKAIDAQIELIGDNLRMDEDALARLASVAPQAMPTQYRSSGQLLYDVLHQGEEDSRVRYRSALKRAAEHMGTIAADTTATAGDLAGLTVDPVVGPVINPVPRGMPFVNAIGLRPMPAHSFERPFLVDPDVGTGVAAQTAQKAELASKKFDVDSDPVKAVTYGGYLNISAQLLRWTPGSLQIILDQMNLRMSRQLESATITELGNSTGSIDLADTADGPTTLQAFYDASAAVYDTTGELATWVLMGPLGWARLGGATDLAGRQLFPTLGASNAGGTSRADTFSMNGPAGLTPVVTPFITDASFWVGNGSCIEAYGYRYPLMDAIEPSVLGRQVAVATDLVVVRPTPVANGAVHVYDAP